MPKKYKLTDLKYEAGQVKRHVLNKVRKGKIKKITKKDTFVLISQRPRLELKSDRTLWNGEAKEYLDSWYCKLIEEIECIQSESYIEIAASIEQNNEDLDLLKRRVSKQNLLIDEYKKLVRTLRKENEELRLKKIDKYGKID